MKKRLLQITILLLLQFYCSGNVLCAEDELFATLKSKKDFAVEISGLLEKAWRGWQDSVSIDDIDVDGSQGRLLPGDMMGEALSARSILKNFDRSGKSQDYINSVRAIALACENGMRSWQRKYSHDNIPFPQGSTCTYTLPACDNVPVMLNSGSSMGKSAMSEYGLYSYMLYRTPDDTRDVLMVFKGAAKAISQCFTEWEKTCSIVGITANGGIAPQPAPMGTGPGPVRGAKGTGGKLKGPYINKNRIRDIMITYFEQEQ